MAKSGCARSRARFGNRLLAVPFPARAGQSGRRRANERLDGGTSGRRRPGHVESRPGCDRRGYIGHFANPRWRRNAADSARCQPDPFRQRPLYACIRGSSPYNSPRRIRITKRRGRARSLCSCGDQPHRWKPERTVKVRQFRCSCNRCPYRPFRKPKSRDRRRYRPQPAVRAFVPPPAPAAAARPPAPGQDLPVIQAGLKHVDSPALPPLMPVAPPPPAVVTPAAPRQPGPGCRSGKRAGQSRLGLRASSPHLPARSYYAARVTTVLDRAGYGQSGRNR